MSINQRVSVSLAQSNLPRLSQYTSILCWSDLSLVYWGIYIWKIVVLWSFWLLYSFVEMDVYMDDS